MELVMPKQSVKKSVPVYDNLSSSKQTFDQVRYLEAINGDVVLRGKQGRRDQLYPLHRASRRFWRWYLIYTKWMKAGFDTQCDELKQVLEMLGAKIQEAIVQRMTGKGLFGVVPKWADAKYMAQLNKAILSLK